jgi:hypothetical protein
MTNRALAATFCLAPTKSLPKNDLGHPACRFAPVGADFAVVDITDPKAAVFSCDRPKTTSIGHLIHQHIAFMPW